MRGPVTTKHPEYDCCGCCEFCDSTEPTEVTITIGPCPLGTGEGECCARLCGTGRESTTVTPID